MEEQATVANTARDERIGSVACLAPPMPPLGSDGVGGWRVLAALRRNAYGAFPRRCLDEPVIRMSMPGRALALVTGATAIRDVLQTNAGDFGRVPTGRRVLGPVVGRGLLTSEGNAWRRQRRAMAPAFTPRTVPVLAGHIARCTDVACERLEVERPRTIDLLAFMQRLSLDIAATTTFSIKANSFSDELRSMITTYYGHDRTTASERPPFNCSDAEKVFRQVI